MTLPLVTAASVAFWLLAPVMILAAVGMILSRKPVHSAGYLLVSELSALHAFHVAEQPEMLDHRALVLDL